MKNHLILLAGGVGSRFGATKPKQFIEVNGDPIIIHTLKRITEFPVISDVTIVCVEDWMDYLVELLKKYNFSKRIEIIKGGNSAHQSIFNGLKFINSFSDEEDIVVIHDSVRPFITSAIVSDSIEKAVIHGNGCASLKSIEGLVIKDDDEHGSIPANRYTIVRIQTPQSFRFSELYKIYKEASENGVEYPYCDGAYLANGLPIYFSKSISANIKITTKSDIVFMKAFCSFTDEELMNGDEQ